MQTVHPQRPRSYKFDLCSSTTTNALNPLSHRFQSTLPYRLELLLQRSPFTMLPSLPSLRLTLTIALVLKAALALPQKAAPTNTDTQLEIAKLVQSASECPEIIPGPGLPSLASLNLTSADLCKPPQEFIASFNSRFESVEADSSSSSSTRLVKRYTPWCNTTPLVFTYAQGCYNYLYALGSTTCHVPSSGSRFCHSSAQTGNVAWYGGSANGASTSSTCRDVARGGEWVLDNCQGYVPGGYHFLYEGANAAWGNANLIVRIGPM
ncbi:hypothetical protein CC2G_013494 [Coprinopsis cinerea AmutBmut pab1-1]|nr:hypothetical protein CC2G_013494 [Coprinopsis cinerea AmutBmut pab1-1]